MNRMTSSEWQARSTALRFETRAFIGADFACPKHYAQGSAGFVTNNPATEQNLATFLDGGAGMIHHAVTAARQAFSTWRLCAPESRKDCLQALAAKLSSARESLALFDSLEMGMPIAMALEQVDDAVAFLRYNAEFIDKLYGEVAPADPATSLAFSQAEPRGVVGIISPWNVPFFTAMLAIAPALAAGNTLVLKPSEQTPSSLLLMAALAAQINFPAGVINVVPGLGLTAGAALASHSDVDLLHFTGSTQVGRQQMVYAGQSNGKPVILELGGKSPQMVFDDASDLLPDLARSVVQSAFHNSGQVCVAKTRLLVQASIKPALMAAIDTVAQEVFRVGDPLDESTTFGPIASGKQYQRVKQAIAQGQEEGSELHRLRLAGEPPRSGFYLTPVVLDHGRQHPRIAREEIFGPVLSVIEFNQDDEAIALANAVDYGLSASAWTQNIPRARRLARDILAGDISIHATNSPATQPFALSVEPFGRSGHGVLGGRAGLRPYQRCKAVRIISD